MKASPLPDIVLYSWFPWNHQYPSTPHGFARALAQYARVWFVNKPLTWKDAWKRKEFPTASAKTHRVDIGNGREIMVIDLAPVPPTNHLNPGWLYQKARKLIEDRMNTHLRNELIKQGVQDYVWINIFAPTQFVNLKLHREPLARFYYSMDAIGSTPYTGRHGVLAEAAQVKVSTAILATAQKLARSQAATLVEQGTAHSKKVHIIHNGMEPGLYLDAPMYEEPEDMRDIPFPRIGFVGNLDPHRIDYDGLLHFAKSRPDISLVLLGPWNAGAKRREAFEAQANIFLLGKRLQPETVPYLQHVNLGLIPFLPNELTSSIYPLKINEYLAMGLPVLSTVFSEDIKSFGDIIHLYPMSEWLENIDEILAENPQNRFDERQKRSLKSTWAARAEEYFAVQGEYVPAEHLVKTLA